MFTPSLADAKARWNRAGEHVDLLNVACQAVIESGGYHFETDCDAEGFGKIIFRDDVDPVLLRSLSTYFGEVVGNLWAARNYVIWHLACLREGTDEPSGAETLGFPVLKAEPMSPNTFATSTQAKLRGLSTDDKALIESVQPYKTGSPDPASGRRQADATAPHYVLEKLAILDRHRRLVVSGLCPILMQPDVVVLSGDVSIHSITPHQAMAGQPLDDGDAVATFIVKGETPYEIAASPQAAVQILPRDVLLPTASFDVWVRRMQASVAALIDTFAAAFGEDGFKWTPPDQLWVPGSGSAVHKSLPSIAQSVD